MSASASSALLDSSFPIAEMEDFRTNAWNRPRTTDDPAAPLFPTILHAFTHAARNSTGKGVCVVHEDCGPHSDGVSEDSWSYAELMSGARRYAARMGRVGVRPGDRVLVVLPTGRAAVVGLFAAQLAGAIPVPAPPWGRAEPRRAALRRLAHMANSCGAAWCLTDETSRPRLAQVALRCKSMRELLLVEQLDQPGPKLGDLPVPTGSMPALIQFTSGATGHPKGALLTHASLTANLHAMGLWARVRRTDVVVSWLPLHHNLGLMAGLLLAVYWHIPFVAMTPETFLSQPEAWLWAIHRHRGTLGAAPSFGFARCTQRARLADLRGLDLSTLRLCLNGGEPIKPQAMRDFQNAFAAFGLRPRAVQPAYGLTEAVLGVSCGPPGDEVRVDTLDRRALCEGRAVQSAERDAVAVACVGAPLPGHQVEVVDDAANPLSERRTGKIMVKGPSLATLYWGEPTATEETLQDGWLHTGDVGYLCHGRLYVTGRAADLIVIDGRTYYPEDIEAVGERVDGVRAGSIVAFACDHPEGGAPRVVVLSETRIRDTQQRLALASEVGQRIEQECHLPIAEVVLLAPGALPRTASGKRQRWRCRRMYMAGCLQADGNVSRKLDTLTDVLYESAGRVANWGRKLLRWPA